MKKEHLRVISEYVGVFPVRINSNRVSAQNRDRWYWTNIRTKETGLFDQLLSDIPQPTNKGINLDDVLRLAYSNRDKSYCIDANYAKGSNLKRYFHRGSRQIVFTDKKFMNNLIAKHPTEQECLTIGKQNKNKWRTLTTKECSLLQTIPDWYEWIVPSSQVYRMLGNGWTVEVIKHIFSFYEP